MRAHFNAFVTSGVAIVGAGIIATPSLITAPPADILVRADANTSHAVNLAADADALQLQEQFDALLAATDLIERIQQAVGYIIEAGFGSGFDPHESADDPIDGTFRLIEGFGASAVRTARGAALLPLGVIAALQAVAEGGDPAEALAQFIRQVIDGPGWAVNPILYALRDTLIVPLGGDPGFFADVQFGLAQAGTALGDVIVALLGLDDTDVIGRIQEAVDRIFSDGFGSGFDQHESADDPVDGMFRLIEGVGASLIRTLSGVALLPLGLLSVPAALLSGDDPRVALAEFIRNTVDGPSWAVNPILFALRDSLIEPLGGQPGVFADIQNQLQSVSKQIGNTIVDLLGLPTVSTMAAGAAASDAMSVDPLTRALEAIDYIVDKGFGSGFEGHRPAEDVVDGFFRLTEGFGAAAVRTVYGAALLPLGLIDVAASVVDGGDTRAALADFITQTVHGPSWAINPVLFALRDALIEPLGGKTGVFADVQNRLQSASKDVGAAIVSLLGLDAAAAEGNSTGWQNVLRTAGERNEPGQAGAMRFAQDGPTALPGGGETLVVESPAADGLKQEQPDKPKIEHRKVEKRELRTGLLPTPVDLGTHRQPQRAQTPVELQQKPGGVKVDRNHKRFTKFTTHESGSPQGASSEAPSSPDRSNDKPTTKK